MKIVRKMFTVVKKHYNVYRCHEMYFHNIENSNSFIFFVLIVHKCFIAFHYNSDIE